jgi:hypothetical protein
MKKGQGNGNLVNTLTRVKRIDPRRTYFFLGGEGVHYAVSNFFFKFFIGFMIFISFLKTRLIMFLIFLFK